MRSLTRIEVIDSHTGGEPTRVVIAGGPDLGGGSMAERLERLRRQFDPFRSAVVNEPRGSDVLVGALLLTPLDPACACGVIFFNNVGYLGMCGHGTIGLIATLAFLERISPGEHLVETPVGTVRACLHEDGSVSVRNVPSYRHAKAVSVEVEGYGTIVGDVAWGGNWFFLVEEHGQTIAPNNVEALTMFAGKIRQALQRNGVTGRDGAEIDHIELFGPPQRPGSHSRSFVLCPGGAYDRSPCGTGTSAKLACLYEEGELRPGEIWRQESVIGSVFEGSVEEEGGALIPTIRGRAYIQSCATLLLDSDDPFCWGIRWE
jgi:4-hydroxyproline epimerase